MSKISSPAKNTSWKCIFDNLHGAVTMSSLNFCVNKGLYLLYPFLMKDETTIVTMVHYSDKFYTKISWNLENACGPDALM